MAIIGSTKVLRDEVRCEREERYHNLELISGEYLENSEHPHTAFIYANMMECDPRCAKILNESSGLAGKSISSFQKSVGKNKSDYKIDESEIVKHLLGNEIVGVEKYKEQNECKFEVIPSDEVYYTNGVPTRIVEFQVLDQVAQNYNYYLLKRYYGIGQTETELFLMDSKKSMYGKKINIATIPSDTPLSAIMERYQEIEITGFDTPAMCIKEYDGTFNTTKTNIYAIERKIVSTNNQVIKFTPEKLLLKGFKSMSDSELDEDTWFQNPEASAEYLSKTNPYIKEAWDIINEEKKIISSNEDIPLDELGFEIGGGIGLESQNNRKDAKNKKTISLRDIISEILSFFEGSDIEVTWQSEGYRDRKSLLEEFKLAKECGAMSQLDVVKEFWDLDDEAAQEKINQINGVNEPQTTETEIV